jgi:hypothetical protein
MRTFLTKLLFKLPASILIRWSGKEQIEKGYRKLDPGFQYLLKVMDDMGVKLDTTKPGAELRKDFEEGRGLVSLPIPSGIRATDHIVKSNGAEIKVREYRQNPLGIFILQWFIFTVAVGSLAALNHMKLSQDF